MQHSLKGKIALVTGASQGIGYATAIALAQQGAHIIATARNTTALEHLDDEIQKHKGTATLVPFDLKEYSAIDALGYEIWKRWKKLDILIANAGTLGILTPLNLLKPEILEECFSVNFMANFRLIRAMHPLLSACKTGGHAIFMTSNAVGKNKPFLSAYAASKAALEEMILTYAHETQSQNMCIQLFNPGAVKTQMRKKIYPGEDEKQLTTPDEIAHEIVKQLTQKSKTTASIYHYPKKTAI